MAVAGKDSVGLFKASNGSELREVFNISGFAEVWRIAFSPDCKFVAISDYQDKRLAILDVKGRLVDERRFSSSALGLDWNETTLAIGTKTGDLYIYKTLGVKGVRRYRTFSFSLPKYDFRTLALDLISLAFEYDEKNKEKALELAFKLLKEDDPAREAVRKLTTSRFVSDES